MIGWLIGIGAAVGGLSGLFGSIGGIEDEKNELRAQKTDIENRRTQLTNDYNYNRTVLGNSYDEGRNDYYRSIASASESRSINANMAAYSNVLADRNEQMQLENTIVAGLRETGQLEQAIASSGFRASEGTTTRDVLDTGTDRISRQIRLSRDQAALSARSRWLSARYDYLDSSRQIDQYRTALSRLSSRYELEYGKLRVDYDNAYSQYTNAMNDIDAQISDINFWAPANVVWDTITGTIGGALSFIGF